MEHQLFEIFSHLNDVVLKLFFSNILFSIPTVTQYPPSIIYGSLSIDEHSDHSYFVQVFIKFIFFHMVDKLLYIKSMILEDLTCCYSIIIQLNFK